MEQQLPAAQFQRIHKSYVVALARITALEGPTVMLGEDQALPIGRAYHAALVQRLTLVDTGGRAAGQMLPAEASVEI